MVSKKCKTHWPLHTLIFVVFMCGSISCDVGNQDDNSRLDEAIRAASTRHWQLDDPGVIATSHSITDVSKMLRKHGSGVLAEHLFLYSATIVRGGQSHPPMIVLFGLADNFNIHAIRVKQVIKDETYDAIYYIPDEELSKLGGPLENNDVAEQSYVFNMALVVHFIDIENAELLEYQGLDALDRDLRYLNGEGFLGPIEIDRQYLSTTFVSLIDAYGRESHMIRMVGEDQDARDE